MLKIRISVDKDESSCSLISFPQGIPEVSDMTIRIGEKGTGQKRKRMAIGDVNGTCFQGVDFPKKDAAMQYAIGLLDEKSGDMRVIPVDHAFVMRLQVKHNEVNKLANLEYNTRTEARTDNFGSKKKKKALKAQKSNIISAENIAGVEAIETAISSTTEEVGDADRSIYVDGVKEALERNRLSLLPKFNMKASKIEDIYPIENMIPTKVMSALMEEFKSIKPVGADGEENIDDDEEESAYMCERKFQALRAPASVKCMLSKIHDAPSHSDSQVAITRDTSYCILVYVTYLVRLYALMSSNRDYKVRVEALNKSRWQPKGEVYRLIVSQFCGKHQKGMLLSSKEQMDKLLLVAIALMLSVGGFSIVLDTLAEDLKTTVAPLSQLCRELGCKVYKKSKLSADDDEEDRGGPSVAAELMFPLHFPELRNLKAPKAKK